MKNIALLLILVGSLSNAQISANRYVLTPAQLKGELVEIPIEGTPYVNEIFKKGESFFSGKFMASSLMRYNAMNEVIEIMDENGKSKELLRKKNITVVIDNVTYEVVTYKEGQRTKLGYLNPMNEGETILYYRPKKQFMQAENPENGYEDYQPAMYKDVSMFYIKKGNEPAEPVKLRKNHILGKLDGKNSLLKKFISEHNLDLKEKSDVVKLLEYYNSLQKTSDSYSGWGETGIGS